jgi:hypothetical protein
VVNSALKGCVDADIVLRELIVEYSNRPGGPPPFLAFYIGQMASDRGVARRPSGRKKATNIVQDLFIVVLIIDLVERFDLKPTRWKIGDERPPAACSIVAAAMAEAGMHRGGRRRS